MSMTRDSQCTRSILFNTGYYLILDLSSRFDQTLINNITEVLSDTLAIGCCCKGLSRIPYFGLGVITSQFDIVWKLNKVKGQYSNIIKSLATVKKIAETGDLRDEDFFDYLHMALKQVMTDINDLPFNNGDNINDTNVKPNLNLVLLTKKDNVGIKYFLKTLMEQSNHQRLNTIQIVELSNNIRYKSVKEDIIHCIQMGGSIDSLEKLFKGWLVNLNFDKEDLILKLSNLELRCDLQEILLNTSLVPFGNSYHLHKDIINSSSTYIPDGVMPVYVLEVIERISCRGISESSVFGYPMQLTSTRQHKYTQFDYSLNSQRFNSMCKVLYDSDEYLIAKLSTNNTNSPSSYFLLMPDEEMMVVKSLCSREIVLPLQKSFEIDDNNNLLYQVKLEMSNLLFGFKLSEQYDPNNYRSGLCSSLRRQLRPRSCAKERSVYEELDNLQSKCNSFSNRSSMPPASRVKRMSDSLHSSSPSTSNNKKQKKSIDNKKDINFINHLGSLR